MPVALTHAYVTGGDDICDVLCGVLERVETVVLEEAQGQLEAQKERLRTSVASHPQWSHLAGDIEHWSDGESAVFGVPDDSPRADQAMRMEYGDENTAPTGLIRMGMLRGVVDMGWSMQERFRRAGY